jgi:tetratricopeptide (TPR) repeat protein
MQIEHKAHGLRRGKGRTIGMIFSLACLWILVLSIWVYAFTWDPQPPIPDYDPQRWEKVRTLWAEHYDGNNFDELIATLTQLKDAYPSKFEPIFLLARSHYLHARYISQGRQEHFEKSERYALQACKMDPKNVYALAVLVETLCYSRDREYIFSHYGPLIRSYAPVTGAEALPDMKYQGWEAFRQLWMARIDIEKAKTAAVMVEIMAQEHPTDGLAQIWAARANYYVGEHYTSTGEHETKALPYYDKGISYGTKARALLPYSVPANYWYQVNRSRSIQFSSLFNKARYLRDILVPLYFCSKENSIYYYCGPVLTLATLVTNGGWVTEKGMRLVNITLEMDMNGLELAEILFPNYYYISYARADILAYKGKKKEALAILEKLITRDPNVDPLIPENHNFIRLAKRLYTDIQQNKY